MYDYFIVFLSTMVVTALVTKWLYQDELQAIEELRAIKTLPKAMTKSEPEAAPIAMTKSEPIIATKSEPIIATIAMTKSEQKAMTKSEQKAEPIAALKAVPIIATIAMTKSEQKAAPKTPSKIPSISREKHDECTRLLEKWNMKHAKHVKDCITTTVESNAEHDAAIKAKKFPEREYIYSDSILPHERTPTHLTRSMHEWWEFERKHSAAPIGSWIHYENPKVQGETTIRVTYAILRIDAPERWQERVYFYHVGETCCA